MPEPPGLAPISQTHEDAEAGSSSEPGRGHSCPICNEVFRTTRGLGVHRAAKHRAQRDQEVARERSQNITKARWNPEEKQLLAEKEVELTKKGIKLLNIQGVPELPRLVFYSKNRRCTAMNKVVGVILLSYVPKRLTLRATPSRGGVVTSASVWARSTVGGCFSFRCQAPHRQLWAKSTALRSETGLLAWFLPDSLPKVSGSSWASVEPNFTCGCGVLKREKSWSTSPVAAENHPCTRSRRELSR